MLQEDGDRGECAVCRVLLMLQMDRFTLPCTLPCALPPCMRPMQCMQCTHHIPALHAAINPLAPPPTLYLPTPQHPQPPSIHHQDYVIKRHCRLFPDHFTTYRDDACDPHDSRDYPLGAESTVGLGCNLWVDGAGWVGLS